MVALHDIIAVLYAGVALISLVAMAVALWHRRARGAVSIAMMMLGVANWSAATAVAWLNPSLEHQAFWSKMMDFTNWMVPFGFFTLGVSIARVERWRRPGIVLALALPIAFIDNLEWLNPGGLYYLGFIPVAVGDFTRYVAVPGPLYWAWVLPAYVLVFTSLVLIVRTYLGTSGGRRAQAATILIGGTIPLAASLFTESRLVPLYGVDLAPLSFLVTGILWLTAILRGSLLDILPVARGVLVEQLPDGVIITDGLGSIVDVNPAAAAMLHMPAHKLLHRPAEDALAKLTGASEVLDAKDSQRTVLPFAAATGVRNIELRVTSLQGSDDPPPRLITMRDVTEERRTRDRLRLTRMVFNTANEGILVVTPTAGDEMRETVVEVNAAYCRMTGYSSEDLIGRSAPFFNSDRHPPQFYETIRDTLYADGVWRGEVWQTRLDGKAFPTWLSLSVAMDDEGTATRIVAVVTDLTDIRTAEDELRFNATHDPLTGLPNRILFDDRLKQGLAYARRAGSGLAVFLIDLDNFKTVNDTMGHSWGDELLLAVARRFRAIMRESDTVGRHGGDEFAFVLPGVEDPVQVEAAARRILDTLSQPYRLGPNEMHITASIGVAMYPTDGEDATTLVQHADIAMYGAKRFGRKRVQFYSDDLQETLNNHSALEERLWDALEQERYFLLYQPQVDLATGRICGAEALLRLRTADGGVLSPSEFLRVAEETDLIVRLGEWVVKTATKELCLLHEIEPELTMSVNLSARQFKDVDVSSLLRNTLDSCGVDGRLLDVEVTEAALMTDPEDSAARIEELRDVAGVRLSLDDFGTGYSSLTYVRMFHANTIKIDRSFISGLPADPESQAVVRTIISLGKELGATIIAEGPETEEQIRFLRANKCDIAQGYFFSRPIPATEFAELLAAGPFALPETRVTAASRRSRH
jgi:diguanylate cyclase (GGDEF)-like protein/PAS domain S-box-containing protein